MSMENNLNKIMQQAQQMQEKMQKAQEELTNMLVTGESGGGLVKVVMNGRHETKSVSINQNLMDDDKDMIEDLAAAAFNDAVRKVEEASRDKIAQLTAGLSLPTDIDLLDDEDK